MVNCCFSTLEPQGAVLLHCNCKSIQGWEKDLWRTSCIAVVVVALAVAVDANMYYTVALSRSMEGVSEVHSGVRVTRVKTGEVHLQNESTAHVASTVLTQHLRSAHWQ